MACKGFAEASIAAVSKIACTAAALALLLCSISSMAETFPANKRWRYDGEAQVQNCYGSTPTEACSLCKTWGEAFTLANSTDTYAECKPNSQATLYPVNAVYSCQKRGALSGTECSDVTVYTNDFESSDTAGWDKTKISTTPSGRKYFGNFSNETATLSLANLPPHSRLTIKFDVYAIQSWDGSTGAGPDRWFSALDEVRFIDTTFSVVGNPQAYPNSHTASALLPNATVAGRTGAIENNTLGWGQDSVYRMSYTLPHNASTANILFGAAGLEGITNESWGIDNVEISVDSSGPERVVYDVTKDYSSTVNPIGPWSYGWVPSMSQYSFSLMTNPGWTAPATNNNIWKNFGNVVQTGVAPGQVSMHPGSSQQPSVIRFTAPKTGSYDVRATFHSGHSGTTYAWVILNGNTAAPMLSRANTDANVSFRNTMPLKAGDRLDFVVGDGYTAGNTPVSITIATLPLETNYTTVPLPILNVNVSGWTDGAIYDAIFTNSVQTWNNVPFFMKKDASGNKVFMGTQEFPVGIFGVTDVYTMMNSSRGVYGSNVGKFEFFGSAGAYQSFDIVEGINIRDHYSGGYNNLIDGDNGRPAYVVSGHGSRLDMQSFHLDQAFADQVLVKVRFVGAGGNPQGEPALGTLTVASSNPDLVAPAITLDSVGQSGGNSIEVRYTAADSGSGVGKVLVQVANDAAFTPPLVFNGETTVGGVGVVAVPFSAALRYVRVAAVDNRANQSGWTDAKVVTMLPPPTAAFGVSATTGEAPLAVQFTDQSGGAITGWQWSFGVGGPATSSQQNPQATFLAGGVYTVTLTVTGSAGSASTSQTVTVLQDQTLPLLTEFKAGEVPYIGSTTLTGNSTISLRASDASGIQTVTATLNGVVLAVTQNDGIYSFPINAQGLSNGNYILVVRATDAAGNVTEVTQQVTINVTPPPAPGITAPTAGQRTNQGTFLVKGTSAVGTEARVYINGGAASDWVPVAGGQFTASVSLVDGVNQVSAEVRNLHGTSARSADVALNFDTSKPATVTSLNALALEQGKIRLSWNSVTDPKVEGVDVYRAAQAFDAKEQASKVISLPRTATKYDDLPAVGGSYFYRLILRNDIGSESLLSNQVSAVSDNIGPKAMSIQYVAQGKYDVPSSRYGQGRVGVTVTVSEALQGAPYLSIVPAGGLPLPVDLTKTDDTHYSGSFLLDSSSGTGVASVIFSARDLVGNRGTDVDAGASLKIDTEGPSLVGIALNPGSPIKADQGGGNVTATFTLSEAHKPATSPQISWRLSGSGRSAVPMGSLTQQSPTVWSGVISLPSDAGQGNPETLSFTYQGTDDLDNLSTKITAANAFQVYQGNLPPLAIPGAFTAKALAGGKVKLDWQAVDGATLYQLYRKAPGEAALSELVRTGGITYTDQTPVDGTYQYAIASIRQNNGQESLSGMSDPVTVQTSATPPGAPQNLSLQLTPQGILAQWQPPVASTVASYNLYRASGTVITSITGLSPLKTGIKQTLALDPYPSSTQGAYVVTALDAAGNESAISNSQYLNASLLPVTDLKVEQIDSALPIVSWRAPNGNVAGYLVYLGADTNGTQLTPGIITGISFTDTGFTSGERRYAVATVDAQGEKLSRSILLPAVTAQIVGGLPIKRGLINKLQVQLTNTSSTAVDNARVVVSIPTNSGATAWQDYRAAAVSLGGNQTQLITVVVGGHTGMPAQAPLKVGIEQVPEEGAFVRTSRTQTVDVSDGALVASLSTEQFTRGASGSVKVTVQNTSDVEVELLTATNNGSSDSSELRFKLLDGDNNVLATQAFKQATGANVVTLANGLTVARIPAGGSYTSTSFSLKVPASSPNNLKVKLEIDKLRYHTGQDDFASVNGLGTEKSVSLVDTAYYGELTDVSPVSSFGDQPIVIAGRALDRSTQAPLASSRLKLIMNQQGFERVIEVLTDGSGNFSHTYTPTLSDSGLYSLSAIHPDMTDRPVQKSFIINRVTVTPSPISLNVPRNYPYSVPLVGKAAAGTSANNLRLVVNGNVPAGVNLQIPGAVNLVERQSLNMPLGFTADNSTPASGSIKLDALVDGHAGPIGQVVLNYTLVQSQPHLVSTPSHIETGLAQGGTQLETLSVSNNGLQDALNLRFTLTGSDGETAAPAWVSIASNANGTLAVGQKRSIDISFAPPADVTENVYTFKLKVEGDNVPTQRLNIYASITQSGQGNVLFKMSDIYTGTPHKTSGLPIPGLAGATITVQNEDVATVSQTLVSDNLGEAYFQALPAGRYTYRARMSNHQEKGGRIQIKPGISLNQPVFLDYNLVQVEWSVKEITIQDRYEITLNTTFETDVPAAVIVLQPTGINLPVMQAGEVFLGELTLQNYGLIRADKLNIALPTSDEFFKYEFLATLPDSLAAKQRLTIPYRITALKSLDQAGAASGGGCYNYSKEVTVGGEYTCANGTVAQTGTRSYFIAASNSSCGGGSGGGGGGTGGGGGGSYGGGWGGGGGFGGGGTTPTTSQSIPGLPPCVKCGGTQCCNPGGGNQPGGKM
jgi:large repetitive protein